MSSRLSESRNRHKTSSRVPSASGKPGLQELLNQSNSLAQEVNTFFKGKGRTQSSGVPPLCTEIVNTMPERGPASGQSSARTRVSVGSGHATSGAGKGGPEVNTWLKSLLQCTATAAGSTPSPKTVFPSSTLPSGTARRKTWGNAGGGSSGTRTAVPHRSSAAASSSVSGVPAGASSAMSSSRSMRGGNGLASASSEMPPRATRRSAAGTRVSAAAAAGGPDASSATTAMSPANASSAAGASPSTYMRVDGGSGSAGYRARSGVDTRRKAAVPTPANHAAMLAASLHSSLPSAPPPPPPSRAGTRGSGVPPRRSYTAYPASVSSRFSVVGGGSATADGSASAVPLETSIGSSRYYASPNGGPSRSFPPRMGIGSVVGSAGSAAAASRVESSGYGRRAASVGVRTANAAAGGNGGASSSSGNPKRAHSQRTTSTTARNVASSAATGTGTGTRSHSTATRVGGGVGASSRTTTAAPVSATRRTTPAVRGASVPVRLFSRMNAGSATFDRYGAASTTATTGLGSSSATRRTTRHTTGTSGSSCVCSSCQ